MEDGGWGVYFVFGVKIIRGKRKIRGFEAREPGRGLYGSLCAGSAEACMGAAYSATC